MPVKKDEILMEIYESPIWYSYDKDCAINTEN